MARQPGAGNSAVDFACCLALVVLINAFTLYFSTRQRVSLSRDRSAASLARSTSSASVRSLAGSMSQGVGIGNQTLESLSEFLHQYIKESAS